MCLKHRFEEEGPPSKATTDRLFVAVGQRRCQSNRFDTVQQTSKDGKQKDGNNSPAVDLSMDDDDVVDVPSYV